MVFFCLLLATLGPVYQAHVEIMSFYVHHWQTALEVYWQIQNFSNDLTLNSIWRDHEPTLRFRSCHNTIFLYFISLISYLLMNTELHVQYVRLEAKTQQP